MFDARALSYLKEAALERLLQYVAVESTARFGEPSPSSPGQVELGRQIADELRAIGLDDVAQDRHGIVTATLPATPGCESRPTLGLLAHLDTSPEESGTNVKTRVLRAYDGSPITFPGAPGRSIEPGTLDELAECVGHDIVVTDGSTLLGADDKAGVAAIVTAVAHLIAHPEIPRPRIRVAMTVDEEIGQGIKHLDIAAFGADVAYTLDDDKAGTIASETFSADLAIVRVRGMNSHPGTARGRMVNAIRVISDIVDGLPEFIAPEHTEGRQGFLHPYDVKGTVAEAELRVLVRDFATPVLAEREEFLRQLLGVALARHPGAQGSVEIVRQYRNMVDGLRDRPDVLDRADAAIRAIGLEPRRTEIRGGTDGSQLTERGLPCPNLFAGMHNAHAVTEWACLDDLALSAATLVALAREWARS